MRGRTLLLMGFCWALLLCAAIALSVHAANNETLPGDRAITDWIQDRAFPGQDISDALRSITGTEAVLLTGAALCLLLWLRGYRRQAILVAAGLALLPLLQLAVKELVDPPRPSSQLVDIRDGFTSSSFPSGHVTSGSYLYAFLAYLALTLPLARWGGAPDGLLGVDARSRSTSGWASTGPLMSSARGCGALSFSFRSS